MKLTVEQKKWRQVAQRLGREATRHMDLPGTTIVVETYAKMAAHYAFLADPELREDAQ